jgi:phenylalanyl-tRNA synthetase beta chain
MKVLYKDLIKFFSETPSKEILSEKLFQLGHEHEVHGEIFDMELTPNRGDCLSLIGIARDLNVFFGKSNHLEIFEDDIKSLDLDFKNLSQDACPKISFLEVEIDGKISEYKPYLKNYFSVLANNKVNFFTDISNYLSYELGQPTHCFDKDSINNQLVFENKTCNQELETLLGSKINIKGQNCVFSINNKIISLAGVVGGMSTACSSKTKKVLVECAYFNPELIIGKSIKYNLISDAAHKFERGVDISSQEMVLRRFIRIVQDHANIKSIKIKTFTNSVSRKNSIPINVDKINKILGTTLNDDNYNEYLQKLGFSVTNAIEVPSYRHDIETQNDLAEEIARVIGYNNISSQPIKFDNINNKNQDILTSLGIFMTQMGFTEVINYPFSSQKEKNCIVIDNPLDSNRQNFRTSLKESLIETLLYNERRQKDSIKLFEVSDIYSVENSSISQVKKIGLIISGRLGNNYTEFSKKLDVKYLTNLLNEFNKNFYIEEISRADLNTKKSDLIFYAEAFLDDIKSEFLKDEEVNKPDINFIKYNPVSQYPSSTRDFSFAITNLSKVSEIIKYFEQLSDKTIKDIFIFDFYKNINTNSIKIGYRLVFQSTKKTLSEKDIQKKVTEVLDPVLKMDGVSIPGM